MDLLHDATDAFGRDGRVALAWSTEAARLRAQLAAGALPLAPQLGRGCAFAEERGLLPLLAELELTRGQLALAGGGELAARDALLRAAELAARCGQRWHAGRASAAAAAAHPDAAGLAESAVELLSGHKPWRARARLVLARRLAERGEASAPREACGALARLEAIGMHADARNAATLARELGGPCT